MPGSTGEPSAAVFASTEKHWPRVPGRGAAVTTESASSRLVSTCSQSVNTCSTRGSLRAGSWLSRLPTTKQPGGPAGARAPGARVVAHSYRPAGVLARAMSASPPRAPPGITTSQEPSAAMVTVTVRAGRPRTASVYAATYRLSCSAATRAASWPHGSAGPLGAGTLGVWSGSTGGVDVHPASSARHPSPAAIVYPQAPRTPAIVIHQPAGSWDRLSRPVGGTGTLKPVE